MLDFIKVKDVSEFDCEAVIVTKIADPYLETEPVVCGMKVLNYCDEEKSVLEKRGMNPNVNHLYEIHETMDFCGYYWNRGETDFYKESAYIFWMKILMLRKSLQNFKMFLEND